MVSAVAVSLKEHIFAFSISNMTTASSLANKSNCKSSSWSSLCAVIKAEKTPGCINKYAGLVSY